MVLVTSTASYNGHPAQHSAANLALSCLPYLAVRGSADNLVQRPVRHLDARHRNTPVRQGDELENQCECGASTALGIVAILLSPRSLGLSPKGLSSAGRLSRTLIGVTPTRKHSKLPI